MQEEFQRRVQRYGWDHAVGYYQAVWDRPLDPAQTQLLERADLTTGESVIDVACGTGLVTFPAAEAVVPGGTVLATDLSQGMVDAGRQVARDRDVHNVSFEQMGAEALDVPDDTFDAGLCALGLMYVPNPEQALRELHRVLVPGGRAVAAVWGARKNCGWAEVFPIVDRHVQSEVCPLFFRLGTGTTLESTFQAAGFTATTTDRLQVELPFDSPDDACTAVFEGGPVALAWRKFDEEQRKGARAEYLTSIEPYRNGNGGYAIPGEFVVARGVRPTAGPS